MGELLAWSLAGSESERSAPWVFVLFARLPDLVGPYIHGYSCLLGTYTAGLDYSSNRVRFEEYMSMHLYGIPEATSKHGPSIRVP